MAPAAKQAALSAEEVVGICRDLLSEQQFVERNKEFRDRRSRLNRQATPKIGGLDLQAFYRSPKLREDGLAYTDKFVSAPMHHTVAAVAEKPKAAEAAQRMENIHYRWWHRWKQSGVIHRAIYDMVTLGYGFWHPFINRDFLPLVPEPGDDEDPTAYVDRALDEITAWNAGERGQIIDCEHLRPETVMWTPDRDVWVTAAQVPLGPLARNAAEGGGGYLRQQGKTVLLTPAGKGELQIKNYDGAMEVDWSDPSWKRHVMLYTVETSEYLYHVVQDGHQKTAGSDRGAWASGKNMALVGCYKNPFGAPSIVMVEGRRTGEDHALHGWVGAIDGLYETEPIRTALGSIILDAAIEAAQQQRTVEPAPGPEAAGERREHGNQQKVTLEANKWRIIAAGWNLSGYTDQLPADVLEAFNIVTQESLALGFPPLLRSPEELVANSGYDRAKAQDSVASRLDPYLENIGEAAIKLFRLADSAIAALPPQVEISVRHVFPTDRLGPVPRSVQEEIVVTGEDIVESDMTALFDTSTRYSRIADIETGRQLLQGVPGPDGKPVPLMSYTQFLTEVMRIDDPARFEMQTLRDEMRQLARSAARDDAVALWRRVRSVVEEETLARPENAALLGTEGSEPDDAVGIPTGPGTARPPEPTPNPEAELGVAGGAESYG